MSSILEGGMMEKLKNSPIFILVLSGLFILILGSFAFTDSETDKNTQLIHSGLEKTMKKDTFDMFLTEYRADIDRIFKLFQGLKK